MQNKMSDLRNHIFAALERLSDENMDNAKLKMEISRAHAVSQLGRVVVETARTQVQAAKILQSKGEEWIEDIKGFLERPKGEYSNSSPMKIASAGIK
jgi:hypothetical protein